MQSRTSAQHVAVDAVARSMPSHGVVDRPGARKAHHQATARLGGLAVVVSGAVGVAALAAVAPHLGLPSADLGGDVRPILTGAAIVFAAGLWDDVRGLSAMTKILI